MVDALLKKAKPWLVGAAVASGVILWLAVELSSCVQEVVYREDQATVQYVPDGVKVYTLWLKTNVGARETEYYVKVDNESTRTLAELSIVVRLVDANGKVVGTATGRGDGIEPGKSRSIQGKIVRSGDFTRAEAGVAWFKWR